MREKYSIHYQATRLCRFENFAHTYGYLVFLQFLVSIVWQHSTQPPRVFLRFELNIYPSRGSWPVLVPLFLVLCTSWAYVSCIRCTQETLTACKTGCIAISIRALLVNGIAMPQMLDFKATRNFLGVQIFLVCTVSSLWFPGPVFWCAFLLALASYYLDAILSFVKHLFLMHNLSLFATWTSDTNISLPPFYAKFTHGAAGAINRHWMPRAVRKVERSKKTLKVDKPVVCDGFGWHREEFISSCLVLRRALVCKC